MKRPARKSILCPSCRKLISVDEPLCPHCGIKTPGSRLKNNFFTRGLGEGDQIVRMIIIANVSLLLFSLLISAVRTTGGFSPWNLLSPDRWTLAALGASGSMMVKNVGWWTLISANYLHGGLLHIMFNMMAFYQLGSLIARLYGAYRFFIIFTVSGAGGFLVSCLFNVPITVGASAGIFGLIGAALYYGKSRGGYFGQTLYKQIGGWALAIILIGFLFPHFIDNSAHIGGLVIGVISAYIVGYHERKREESIHRLIAGTCMIITILVLLKSIWRGLLYWFGAL